jgi:class 3 adenylate cyclase
MVNAAALFPWAGEPARAHAHARAALALVDPGDRGAWSALTRAEAHLILGDVDAARSELARVDPRDPARRDLGWTDLASTVRQLRRHCDHLGRGREILARLAPPRVAVYVGGDDAHAADDVGFAFGGLHSAGEIAFAERIAEAGGEVHVVLPFPAADYEAACLADRDAPTRARYAAALARATSCRHASRQAYRDDPASMRYALRYAMGLAALRARALESEAVLVDFGGTEGLYDQEIALWRVGGRRVLGGDGPAPGRAPQAGRAPAPGGPGRSLAAILFCDVVGYSGLGELQVPAYAERILGGVAAALEGCGGRVLCRNTWGDAIYAVVDDVTAAARAAAAIHRVCHERPLGAAGRELRMRIGAHYAPVVPVFDPVQGQQAFMGVEVVQAARIEPIAAPGTTYVTEAFAAMLALDPEGAFVCDYLGVVRTAKGYGSLPLYAVQPR